MHTSMNMLTALKWVFDIGIKAAMYYHKFTWNISCYKELQVDLSSQKENQKKSNNKQKNKENNSLFSHYLLKLSLTIHYLLFTKADIR